MIDTVTLRLNSKQFKIKDISQFNITKTGKGYKDMINEQTRVKTEYLPSVRLRERYQLRSISQYLYIDFSAPKLLQGNNLEEITTTDIPTIYQKLYKITDRMGVEVNREQMECANVVKIHFGKNIVLPYSIFPSMIINRIHGNDWSGIFNALQRDYSNDGTSLRVGNNSREVILYDKIRELSFDRNSKELFTILKALKIQVLRMEVRFKTERVIRRETGLLKGKLTLQKLTFHKIVEKVLSEYWSLLTNNTNYQDFETTELEKVYANLLMQNPKLSLKDVNSIFSYLILKQEFGEKKARSMITRVYSQDTWSNFKQLFYKHQGKALITNEYSIIQRQLKNYEPLRLTEFTNPTKITYTIS